MKALFFFSMLFLPVDGWPLGAAFLREFGVRPTNFFLLLLLPLIIIGNLKHSSLAIAIHRGFSKNILLIFIFLLILNISFILIKFLASSIDSIQATKGFLQFLLVLWFFTSLKLWTFLFDRLKIWSVGYGFFISCLMFCVFVNLCFFGLDFYNSKVSELPVINEILFFFRGEHDVRTSGLSSEPSTYASWALLVWPLLIFPNVIKISKTLYLISLMLGIASLFAALISGSRTFLLVFAIQMAIFLIVILVNRVRNKIIIVSTFFCTVVVISSVFFNDLNIYVDKFISILDLESNYSSITRLGSALAAFNMFLDNWLLGVGIGQFTYSYSHYVPDWALASPEVMGYVAGDIKQRINAFNLFLRIGAELGLIAFLLFAYFILDVVLDAFRLIKRALNDQLWLIGVVLAFIGGVSYWMQQDLFSYQPGIFSIALVIYLSSVNSSQSH